MLTHDRHYSLGHPILNYERHIYLLQDYKNITDTLGQVKALENKAKQARDTQLSTTKIDQEMLESNVENARRKVDFKEPLHQEEHFQEIFHPRLLYRVNTTSVYELYIATAALPADTRIPTNDYDYQHLSGIGIQISPKGWLYAHRPDLPGFDICFYANIDVASMTRRQAWYFGKTQGTPRS